MNKEQEEKLFDLLGDIIDDLEHEEAVATSNNERYHRILNEIRELGYKKGEIVEDLGHEEAVATSNPERRRRIFDELSKLPPEKENWGRD